MRQILVLCFALILGLSAPLAARVKAVVFDCGGVIVSPYGGRSTLDEFSRLLNIPADQLVTSLTREMSVLSRGEVTDLAFWPAFVTRHGGRLPPNWIQRFREDFRNSCRPIAGMRELVAELQAAGYITAMLSNTLSFHSDVLREEGVYRPFYPVILSNEVGMIKPDPAIFQHLLRQMGLAPNEVVVVDDLPANVEAARREGIHGVVFRSSEQLRDDLVEYGVVLNPADQIFNPHYYR